MQLYQNRGFNEFFQDTFTFIKENGKHYFKNYFIINGALLIILAVLTYYFTQLYTKTVYSGMLGGNGTDNILDTYIDENLGLFIVLSIAIFCVALVFGVVSYAYTPIYFKLYEEHNDNNFETQDILNAYKKKLLKLLTFLGLGFLLAFPLIIILGVGMFVLAITIIGILAIPLLIGLFAGLYNMTLLEYLDNKRTFWDSFGYAWTLITSKFWHAVGCMGIFYIITYIIQLGLSIFQSIFNTANILTGIENTNASIDEQNIGMTIFLIFMFILTFLVGIIMSNINQVNQSVIYYGLKEEKENINTKSEIDLIGDNIDA